MARFPVAGYKSTEVVRRHRMKVEDAMTPRSSLVTVELPGSRDDALEYLQERSFSSVPVVKSEDGVERFRGLVSREKLIENPNEDQLALLLEEVPTIGREANLRELCSLMVSNGARRIPVVDGELEGIITITDMIRAIANGDVPGATEVGAVADRHVNSVYGGAPLVVAERELFYANESYAVVLDAEGAMDGIITAVDIIDVAEVVEGEEGTGDSIANQDSEWLWEGIKAVGNRYLPTRNVEFPDAPVDEFKTEEVVTVTTRRTAAEAAQLMIQHDIEQIPLVSGDTLIGIVQDMHLLEAAMDE